MTVSQDAFLPPRTGAIAPEYLEAYAEADAQVGSPNPRFKQSSIYSSRYLTVRTAIVGFEQLSDAELDLRIF
ncbi:MAG: hypothetical protein AAGH78_13730 [Cyanobacteria bacterium P01_H01_bin.58]